MIVYFNPKKHRYDLFEFLENNNLKNYYKHLKNVTQVIISQASKNIDGVAVLYKYDNKKYLNILTRNKSILLNLITFSSWLKENLYVRVNKKYYYKVYIFKSKGFKICEVNDNFVILRRMYNERKFNKSRIES